MRGIDVSGRGTIDYAALKAAGYDFLIARAGYGSSIKQKDKGFDTHVQGAAAVGLHVGAYWFLYARSAPEAQQNGLCFSDVCKPYAGILDMPLYIDYEDDTTRYYEQETGQKETKLLATSYITLACAQLESKGWYTGYYVNLNYLMNRLHKEPLERYALWLAVWRNENKPPLEYKPGIWQYAGDATIKESNAPVDLNIGYVDYPTAIRNHGLNGFKTSGSGHDVYGGKDIRLNKNGTWSFLD